MRGWIGAKQLGRAVLKKNCWLGRFHQSGRRKGKSPSFRYVTRTALSVCSQSSLCPGAMYGYVRFSNV